MAEYWHIGETTMRFESVSLRSLNREKSADMAGPTNRQTHRVPDFAPGPGRVRLRMAIVSRRRESRERADLLRVPLLAPPRRCAWPRRGAAGAGRWGFRAS